MTRPALTDRRLHLRPHQRPHERLRDLFALLLVLAAVGIVWLTLPVYAVGTERLMLTAQAEPATSAAPQARATAAPVRPATEAPPAER